MKLRVRKGSLKFDAKKKGWLLPEGCVKTPCGGMQGASLYHIVYQEDGERKEFWMDDASGFTYRHRPVLRKRGFVELLQDGEVVYILNIREERFMPYRNWEIRADERICTVGNKLYFCRETDGSGFRIKRRSDDFRLFVVEEWHPKSDSGRMVFEEFLIINEAGKKLEVRKNT